MVYNDKIWYLFYGSGLYSAGYDIKMKQQKLKCENLFASHHHQPSLCEYFIWRMIENEVFYKRGTEWF